jgi:hypothetical protein
MTGWSLGRKRRPQGFELNRVNGAENLGELVEVYDLGVPRFLFESKRFGSEPEWNVWVAKK